MICQIRTTLTSFSRMIAVKILNRFKLKIQFRHLLTFLSTKQKKIRLYLSRQKLGKFRKFLNKNQIWLKAKMTSTKHTNLRIKFCQQRNSRGSMQNMRHLKLQFLPESKLSTENQSMKRKKKLISKLRKANKSKLSKNAFV